jgi:Predicted nucleotide-binding protein containing TIR-like domain
MAAPAPSGTGRSECCAQTARLLAAAPGARPRPGDAWTCDHIEAVINGGVGTSRFVKRSGPKMYNLLMVARDGLWNEVNVSSFEYDRFMSYTHEALKARFLPLSDKAIGELVGLPTLFAYEFKRDPPSDPSDEPPPAHVGNLFGITRRQTEVEFQFALDPNIAPIPTGQLRALAHELDIDLSGLECYRSHWAVKDIDLLAVLRNEGLIGPGEPIVQVTNALRALAADVPKPSATRQKIFIVHGRKDGLKNEVGRWLGRIGLDDVILHEQPNVGRTLITKFEEVAKDVAFAVVLITPDDVGGLAGEGQRWRARQNVIFELGYFIGKFGLSRVVALVDGDIETPSDYQGVVYIPYDSAGGWKLHLAREFKALNLRFDLIAGI